MKHTTIAIHARSLGLQNGGVYRYVVNVLRELDRRVADGEPLRIYIIHNEAALHQQFSHCIEIYRPCRHSYFHRFLFDYFYSAYYLHTLHVDYVLYPKNIIPCSHYLVANKKISTILDLGHFETAFRAYRLCDTLYAKALLKLSCRMAYKILAISHSTKHDIINKLRIDPQKIHVMYLGVDEHFQPRSDSSGIIQKFQVQRPFLFYNGSITPRKNLLRLLEAFYKIKDRIPHRLYLTGALQWGADRVYDYIERHLKERVRIVGYVEEHDLPSFYSLADMMVYPSLYEGFGLPILEAQACGCPVLTSNLTACPEIAGQGAHIVNPYSVEDIQQGILQILHNDAYRRLIIQRGFENSQRFCWNNTAEEILHICT